MIEMGYGITFSFAGESGEENSLFFYDFGTIAIKNQHII
jgi:hypothetical protein